MRDDGDGKVVNTRYSLVRVAQPSYSSGHSCQDTVLVHVRIIAAGFTVGVRISNVSFRSDSCFYQNKINSCLFFTSTLALAYMGAERSFLLGIHFVVVVLAIHLSMVLGRMHGSDWRKG